MSFNKIILVGNLGKDPDLRYTPQGDAVCSFSVATNEKRRDRSGESVDVTTWFKVTLWRKQAENAAKYLKKSSPVYIEGRLQMEEWTDREGNNRYTLGVQATEMQFISAGNSDRSEPTHSGSAPAPTHTGGAPTAAPPPPPAKPDDDIPF